MNKTLPSNLQRLIVSLPTDRCNNYVITMTDVIKGINPFFYFLIKYLQLFEPWVTTVSHNDKHRRSTFPFTVSVWFWFWFFLSLNHIITVEIININNFKLCLLICLLDASWVHLYQVHQSKPAPVSCGSWRCSSLYLNISDYKFNTSVAKRGTKLYSSCSGKHCGPQPGPFCTSCACMFIFSIFPPVL